MNIGMGRGGAGGTCTEFAGVQSRQTGQDHAANSVYLADVTAEAAIEMDNSKRRRALDFDGNLSRSRTASKRSTPPFGGGVLSPFGRTGRLTAGWN